MNTDPFNKTYYSFSRKPSLTVWTDSLTLEQLQILERKEIYQFNTEKLIPFLYKTDRKTAQRIANFKGLNKRGRLRTVWQKAFSAFQTENPSESDRHYERMVEINRAIQQKLKQTVPF